MKIEFENAIRRLSFFVPSQGHQNCLDKSLNERKMYKIKFME